MRKGIQLAYPFEEKRLRTWPTPWIVQPKLDGERCRALIDQNGRATLLSSEENIITSVPHIVHALEELGLSNIELDGELYTHGMPFEEIHSRVGRTVNLHEDYKDIEYHIFDIVSDDPQSSRIIRTVQLVPDTDYLRAVEFWLAYSLNALMERYDNIVVDGYEGFIVRNAFAPYVRKRSTSMMKFKPKKFDYYQIVAAEEEISIHGDLKNALGALVLSGAEGGVFRVGTGFTREQRIELWKQRYELPGKIAEVKYQHLTEKKVPRFPVFVSILDRI